MDDGDESSSGADESSADQLEMKPNSGDFCADMRVDLFPEEEFPDTLSLSVACEGARPIQEGGLGQDFTEYLHCLQGGIGYEAYSMYEVSGETNNVSRDCWQDAVDFCASCLN